MPKQFRKNQYNPDRYQRSAKKAMDSLRLPVEELETQQQTAAPNLRRDQVKFGTTKLGVIENKIGGSNTTAELAELLSAGVDVAVAAGQGIGLYNKNKDEATFDTMQGELDQLKVEKAEGTEIKGTAPAAKENAGSDYNPDFVDTDEERAAVETSDRKYMTDEEYEKKREVIYDRYRGQLRTKKFKRKLDSEITANKINLVNAPIEDKITAFNEAKFRIERDESYALMEDGLEQRTQDLEDLYDQFYDTMQKEYGNDPSVMTRVQGLIGARRLESSDQAARRRNKEAVSLYNTHLPRITNAIGEAINDMVGVAPGNDRSAVGTPSSGTMYVDETDFAEDILVRAGLTEDQLDAQPEVLEEFYEVFGKRVADRFKEVESEVAAQIESHLDNEITKSIGVITSNLGDGELPNEVSLIALEEQIMDEYSYNTDPTRPNIQSAQLTKRLQQYADLLPYVYFTGSAAENTKAAKERLESIADKLGFKLEDTGIVLNEESFDPSAIVEVNNMADLQRVFSRDPRNDLERAATENAGKNLGALSAQSSLNFALVNNLSMQGLAPSLVSNYRDVVLASLLSYVDSPESRPAIDFLEEEFDKNDTYTEADKWRMRNLLKEASMNPRFHTAELARTHLNGGSPIAFKNGIIDAKGAARLFRDKTGNFAVEDPQPTDLTGFGKNGNTGFISIMGGKDAGLLDLDSQVENPIKLFIASDDALLAYSQLVTLEDGRINVEKAVKIWQDVYKSAGLTIEETTARELVERFNPETLATIVEQSKKNEPFNIASMDDIMDRLVTENAMSGRTQRQNLEDASKSLVLMVSEGKKDEAEALAPYVSEEAFNWALKNGIDYVNPEQMRDEFLNRGMQITQLGNQTIIAANPKTLNARLNRSPYTIHDFDGRDAFQLDRNASKPLKHIRDNPKLMDNESLGLVMNILRTLEQEDTSGGAGSRDFLDAQSKRLEKRTRLYTRKVLRTSTSYGGRWATTYYEDVTQITNRGLLTHIAAIELGLSDEDISTLNPENVKFTWSREGELQIDFSEVSGFSANTNYTFDRELGALLLSESLGH